MPPDPAIEPMPQRPEIEELLAAIRFKDKALQEWRIRATRAEADVNKLRRSSAKLFDAAAEEAAKLRNEVSRLQNLLKHFIAHSNDEWVQSECRIALGGSND